MGCSRGRKVGFALSAGWRLPHKHAKKIGLFDGKSNPWGLGCPGGGWLFRQRGLGVPPAVKLAAEDVSARCLVLFRRRSI